MDICEKHRDFVFVTAGIHPELIRDIDKKTLDNFIAAVKKNTDNIVGIGEVGLDYWWIKEKKWQEKQKELFVTFIRLAKHLKKPLVIHARDASEDAIKILEEENANHVLMHMFGAHHLLDRVIENGWYVSMNTIVLRSKKHRKIARDIPLDRLLTETDAPWLDPDGGRNTPLNVRAVIEKIADIRKTDFDEIDRKTTENAIRFFRLTV